MSEKSAIRRDILKKRDSIDLALRAKKNAVISDTLKSLPEFRQAKTLLFYVSFGSEVDTIELIRYSLKGKFTVTVPRVEKETSELSIHRIEDLSLLKPGAFGILEPAQENNSGLIDVDDIDLVIVPGVAFDIHRNRLGYGKGYYDKLLAPLKNAHANRIAAIALAYEEQIVHSIPSEPHDIRMDLLITDERIL